MSDTTSPYQARYFLNPLNWPMWLVIGLLWLTTRLSYRSILRLGAGLGRIGYYLLPSRRRIVRTNIRLTHPGLDEAAVQRLVKDSFFSAGLMLFEMAWAWWGKDAKIQPLVRYEGLEHLQAAEAQGKGVLLLGSHFTTLELQGRLLAYRANNIYPTYKPAHNSLFELIMTYNRRRMNKGLITSRDMRGILKLLKRRQIIWYAPDQDFGADRSVFAPFMGIQTSTLTMTARLAEASGAPMLPLYCDRLPGDQGYVMRIGPPLRDFPSGDAVRDAAAINAAIEAQVRRVPEQYIWGHRRFKTRPRGEPQLYKLKRRNLRSYSLTLALLSLPALIYTLWIGLRERDASYILERLGLARTQKTDLIVHAASIGEVNAVVPLLELLLARFPHIRVLLSVNTPSGRRIAQQRLGDKIRYRYMPVDWRWSVYRYLAQTNPQCAWIVETELWPNFLEACYYRGIRSIIINGRLSARSTDSGRLMRQWLRHVGQYIFAVMARSNEDAQRYLSLNVTPEYVQVLGNLKYASTSTMAVAPTELGRDYVLLASSRDGEERKILQTWLALAGDKPLLVIVPRHIRRLPEILRDLQNLTDAISIRSREDRVTAKTEVYIADTFGELRSFIQGAQFVIMGGSFEPFGGQNIIEVAQAGKALVFGPHMENFYDEARDFIAAGAAMQVEDQRQLSSTLTSLLQHPEQRQQLAQQGSALVTRYTHVTEMYLEQLLRYCPSLAQQHQAS
ncbi:MAG: LpxL/LpxP family Kdo(2)-lipid IV(A) lauroyl/palmitoleoyl acyltransferase [Gammaproteobacteria bacterium]